MDEGGCLCVVCHYSHRYHPRLNSSAWLFSNRRHADARFSGELTLAFLATAWFAVLSFLPRFGVRRQFRNQPGVHGPRTVVFDAEGAHWRWDGGSSDVAWKNYIQSIEGDKQILLYGSPAAFTMIPKRTLDPAQLAELRELLKQNIQPKK